MSAEAPPGPGFRLRFPQVEREVHSRAGETIQACARRHGLRIIAACGGRGVCGSCLIRVIEGSVTGLSPASGAGGAVGSEPSAAGKKKWLRACQYVASSDCIIEVSARSLAPVVRAEVQSDDSERLAAQPAVQACDVTLQAPTLQECRSDTQRLVQGLSQAGQRCPSVDLGVARVLPGVFRERLRAGSATLRAWVRAGEVIAVGPAGQRGLALAIDLGTTNIGAFLLDVHSGERLATLGMENPQAAWGGDVISRINAAMNDAAAAQELRRAAVEAINGMAHDLCEAVGLSAEAIVEVALCGNTAMHHLLLGLPVRQLGRAPFVAATDAPLDLRARDLGLAVAPGAWVHVLGGVGGFVGGDHVTALLATEEHWAGAGPSVVMDIGTNTEISVIESGRILCASAPSGPALEGGHISCGMRAAAGAIERVSVVRGQLHVETIGDKPAIGLCGSGVLDTVAALLEAQLINGSGRIVPEHARLVTQADGTRALRLARAVQFSQRDLRSVQLAKAAIRTATELLLEEAGLAAGQIERFVIAGSFGAYISVRSAIAIGLFPPIALERYVQVGNAAGAGVRLAAVSSTARTRAAELAATSRYVELSTRGTFQKCFLHHIGFHERPRPGASA